MEARVQTFIRIRPHMKTLSITERKKNFLKFNKKEVFVSSIQNREPQTYEFDGVFGPTARQEEVFRVVAKPVISDVLLGYNCTVLAYGQTGSGKTYTMFGEKPQESIMSWHKEDCAGLIIRTIDSLFNELAEMESNHYVSVTYLELCNEQLFDLIALNGDGNNIKIYEDANKGTVRLTGVTSVQVVSKEEVFQILEKGALHRKSAGTHIQGELSRSHSILTIKVYIKENAMEEMGIFDGTLTVGSLNLVDLADSSPISKACGVDKFMRQAATSNQSLLQLGRVITALAEKAQHIPYRASKLTRILQDSLGGQTKTTIISTISPSPSNLDETLNTLKYSASARNIINRPVINTLTDIKNMFKVLCKEIQRLTWDLEATFDKSGVYFTEEEYREICCRSDQQKTEYKEKLELIRSLKNEIKVKEAQLTELRKVFKKECAHLESIQTLLKNTDARLGKLNNMLDKTKAQVKEKEFLVSTMKSNEDKFFDQAKVLKSVCTDVSKDACALHEKLERVRYIGGENKNSINQFRENILRLFKGIEENCNWEEKLQCLRRQKNIIVCNYTIRQSAMKELNKDTFNIIDNVRIYMGTLEKQIQSLANSCEECGNDPYSLEIIKRGKKVITYSQSHIQSILEESMHHFMERSESLANETKKELSKIDHHMDLLISEISQFEQSLIVLKNCALTLIDGLIKALHECTEGSDMIISACKRMESHVKAQLMKLLELAKKLQDLSNNNNVTNALKNQKTFFISTFNKCSEVENKTDKMIKNIAVFQDTMNSNLMDCQKRLKETASGFQQKFQETIYSSDEATKLAENELNTFMQLCNEKCEQYKESAIENVKTYSAVGEDHITCIKQAGKSVASTLVIENEVQYLDTLFKKKDALLSDYANNKNLVLQMQHQVATDVKKLTTAISEFRLKTNAPTGDTPERKEYKLPVVVTKSIIPRTITETEALNEDSVLEEKD